MVDMDALALAQFAYDLAIVVGTETGAENIPLLLDVRCRENGCAEATFGFLASQDMHAAIESLNECGVEVTDFSVLALKYDVESVILVHGYAGNS